MPDCSSLFFDYYMKPVGNISCRVGYTDNSSFSFSPSKPGASLAMFARTNGSHSLATIGRPKVSYPWSKPKEVVVILNQCFEIPFWHDETS